MRIITEIQNSWAGNLSEAAVDMLTDWLDQMDWDAQPWKLLIIRGAAGAGKFSLATTMLGALRDSHPEVDVILIEDLSEAPDSIIEIVRDRTASKKFTVITTELPLDRSVFNVDAVVIRMHGGDSE